MGLLLALSLFAVLLQIVACQSQPPDISQVTSSLLSHAKKKVGFANVLSWARQGGESQLSAAGFCVSFLCFKKRQTHSQASMDHAQRAEKIGRIASSTPSWSTVLRTAMCQMTFSTFQQNNNAISTAVHRVRLLALLAFDTAEILRA